MGSSSVLIIILTTTIVNRFFRATQSLRFQPYTILHQYLCVVLSKRSNSARERFSNLGRCYFLDCGKKCFEEIAYTSFPEYCSVYCHKLCMIFYKCVIPRVCHLQNKNGASLCFVFIDIVRFGLKKGCSWSLRKCDYKT